MNSDKWEKMADWINNHQEGWAASHIGDFFVSQGDFGLTYSKDSEGIVIAFKDKKPKKYTNYMNKGELNFLY